MLKMNGKYFSWLEKKSNHPITLNMIKSSAVHIANIKFPNIKKNIAIVFCHTTIKRKVIKNFYFKLLRKNIYDNSFLVYSNIIPKNLVSDNDKRSSFVIETKNDDGKYITRIVGVKSPKNYGVRRIISGGQTGADYGGLLAGIYLKSYTGGAAPKGYMTENGCNLNLKRFGLYEHEFANYKSRTMANVVQSNGTFIFGNDNSVGSATTKKFCISHNRPYMIFNNKDMQKIDVMKDDIILWLIKNNIKVLNVAGNRESRNRGITKRVFYFMVKLLSRSELRHQRAYEIVHDENKWELFNEKILENKNGI